MVSCAQSRRRALSHRISKASLLIHVLSVNYVSGESCGRVQKGEVKILTSGSIKANLLSIPGAPPTRVDIKNEVDASMSMKLVVVVFIV